jgi:hypothetical protein
MGRLARWRKSVLLDTLARPCRRHDRRIAMTSRQAVMRETIRLLRETDLDGAIAAKQAVG